MKDKNKKSSYSSDIILQHSCHVLLQSYQNLAANACHNAHTVQYIQIPQIYQAVLKLSILVPKITISPTGTFHGAGKICISTFKFVTL